MLTESQPVLDVMLQKASQARALYSQSREPVFPVTRADDEFSFVAGRTKLVNNLDDSSNPHPSHSSSSQGTATSTSNYGSSSALYYNATGPLSGSYLNSIPATLADIGGGWDGLFYELPQPSYQRLVGKGGKSERTWVDDSTTPFMNYGVLMQPPFSQSHPSQLLG